jgi:transcriptional regulator NrdR family protein
MTCRDCGADHWRIRWVWHTQREVSRRRLCLECGREIITDERIRNGSLTNETKIAATGGKNLTLSHVRRPQ